MAAPELPEGGAVAFQGRGQVAPDAGNRCQVLLDDGAERRVLEGLRDLRRPQVHLLRAIEPPQELLGNGDGVQRRDHLLRSGERKRDAHQHDCRPGTPRAFGKDGAPLKILVVPALPQSAEAREQSIALLRSKGVDAVIPFQTMLADLVGRIEVNRNYQKSDLLQIIRILKNYDFFREPQLELFKGKGKKRVTREA